MADSTGVEESLATSLISLRDETALKELKRYSSLNNFFYALLWFCQTIISEELKELTLINKLFTKLVKKDLLIR